MCMQCHLQLIDEEVLKTFKDALEEPKFENWNESSLSHIFLALSGVNGQEVVQLAKQLLANFCDWIGAQLANPEHEFSEEEKAKLKAACDNIKAGLASEEFLKPEWMALSPAEKRKLLQ